MDEREPNRSVRPIPADEIEALPPLPGEEVASAETPGSRLTVHLRAPRDARPEPRFALGEIEGVGDETLWRCEIDLGADQAPRYGRSEEALEPERVAPFDRTRRAVGEGLPGFRPPQLSLSYLPRVERQPGRVTYEHRGRRYRPLYIFGSDDRHVLVDTSWPWLTVGKVTTSDGDAGSGALVGGRIMLTARHVRPGRSIDAGSWWMKFTPHAFDGMEPFGSSFVSDLRIYFPTGDTGVDVAHDYMACRLYEPLGERLGYFGTQEYTEDWNDVEVWAGVGYPGELSAGGRPFVQLRCSFEDSEDYDGGQIMESEADLTRGDSGGPFWAWFPTSHGNTPRIVAVTAAELDFGTSLGFVTIHDHDNALAGGADLVRLVEWARQNWT